MGSLLEQSPAVYDLIICGGGTSGCVLAGRLAEDPNVKILVIEAGGDNKDLEDVHMPGAFGNLLGKETDWNVTSSIPAPGINDRQIKLSRGKFLGGTSGCNGTICARGSKQDYDDWGLEGWSGEEFFGYMKKAETFHPKPWFKTSWDAHGQNGPLHTEIRDVAPISELILKSMKSQGLPQDDDMFSHGETPHGCGHATRSTYNGTRSTAADYITGDSTKSNITIALNTYVDKVLFAKDPKSDEPHAAGVRIVGSDGRPLEVLARKEVILCGGAFCSPAILNRSGIGASSDLSALGINTLVDLPGVGGNLMDHLVVFMFYETTPGLTHDHHIHHGTGYSTAQKLWRDTRSGFMANYPSGVFAFARLDDRLADSDLWNASPREPGRDPMGLTPQQPNVEFWNTEAYGGPNFYDNPEEGRFVFGMVAELFGQKSRGTVKITSTDPTAAPEVNCAYLTNDLDVEVLAEACRLSNEVIMNGESTKNIVKGSWPPSLVHHTHTSREDWAQYVRESATSCFHYSGTCAMGKANDPQAVVNEKLFVKGVKGLRVADCSIIPTLHGGHTQMPAYGIGEKCADLVKEAWGFKTQQNAKM